MSQLISFFGDPSIKEKYLKQLKLHYKNDEIIQGQYWGDGKGCAVGCLIHSSYHAYFEKMFGLPEWLAYIVDRIFESLKDKKAKRFAVLWFDAVPVGVNLEIMKHKFFIFLLQKICKNTKQRDVKKSIQKIISLHVKCVKLGDCSVSDSDWSVAELAARSAARSASWSGGSAELAVRSAAWSAVRSAESAAESAARSAALTTISEKLIELLRESK